MMMAATLRHLDQLLHTADRGRPLNVDESGRLPVRLYGPDGQPLFTEQNPAHVKGEVTLTGRTVEWHTLADAIALVDTSNVFTNAIPSTTLIRYKSLLVVVDNSHDQDVRLQPWSTLSGNVETAYRRWDDQGNFFDVIGVIAPANIRRLLMHTHPNWQSVFGNSGVSFPWGLRFRMAAVRAPGTGSITVMVGGIPN